MPVKRQDHFGGRSSWLIRSLCAVALLLSPCAQADAAATEPQQAESDVLTAQGVVAYDEHRYEDALRLLSRFESGQIDSEMVPEEDMDDYRIAASRAIRRRGACRAAGHRHRPGACRHR